MRLRRWQPLISSRAAEWWHLSGAYFAHMCSNDLKGAPKCVIAACLKTGLNGWATARRCGRETTCCLFGCRMGSDCLEHYMDCKICRRLFERLYLEDWGTVEERFAVGCTHLHSRIKRALFLYCMYWVYNVARHSSRKYDFHGLLHLVKRQLIFVLGRCSVALRSEAGCAVGVLVRRNRQPVSSAVGTYMFRHGKRPFSMVNVKPRRNTRLKLS